MSELTTRRLADIAEIVTGATPSAADVDAWGDELDFITPSDQNDSSREAQPGRRLSAIGMTKLARRIVPPRSTNLTCIGSIGKVSMTQGYAVTNQQINSIIALDGISDENYIYYMIKNWSSILKLHASGSATPIVNKTNLSNYEFVVPSLERQQAIGQVLGALDDKIAANTKLVGISATLAEFMFAEAVRTSADEVILSEVTSLLSRGITPKYSDDQDTVVILNQKCIRGQRVDLHPARRTLKSKVREDKLLIMDDVLVNSTGQGTLGRLARWTHSDSVTVDSHITVVRFDQAKVDSVCAGMALLSLQEIIVEMGEGSTGQTELSRTELGKLRVRLPDRGSQAELGRRFTAMAEMERVHLSENQFLAATRDALLPQLMSGKLRVKDAEKVLEDAGV